MLCGTVSTNLTFQGSGTSGNYVTIDGSGAKYSGSITNAGKSWWQVRNVTWADGNSSELMLIRGGSNGVFSGNYADNTSGGNALFLAQNGTERPSNITITGNFIRTTAADMGNSQHDMIATEGSTSVIIEKNHLELRVGGSGSYAHDDVIQTFQKGGTNGGPPANWTVRFNRIVMNSNATNDRSWMMLEAMSGTNNIYGNEFIGLKGAEGANGISASLNGSDAVFNIYNNTFVAKNGASNNVLNLAGSGVANVRNNIVHTQNQTALTGNMRINRSNNLWFGNNIPSCSGGTAEICGRDPMFQSYVNNQFGVNTGSPAINAAGNLGTAYGTYVLPTAIWPNPTTGERPTSGNWTVGAH